MMNWIGVLFADGTKYDAVTAPVLGSLGHFARDVRGGLENQVFGEPRVLQKRVGLEDTLRNRRNDLGVRILSKTNKSNIHLDQ